MKRFQFPIRLKIMIALLLSITATVGFITFTMARYFHADKQTYINDWVSIAALSTADECETMLSGYSSRLRSYARVLHNPSLSREEKNGLMQGFFVDLPELIDLTLLADGEVVETATDKLALQKVGLDLSDLQAARARNPLPSQGILDGELYIRNTTLTEELPAFTISVPVHVNGTDGSPVIVSALMRLDGLLRLGAKFRVFEILLVDSDGRLLAHPDVNRVAGMEQADLQPEAQTLRDRNESVRTIEFVRDGEQMIGGFASVLQGDLTVAAHVPKSAAYLASRELLTRLVWVTLLVLVLCAVAGQLWARRITRPVERLARATKQIAKGSFEVQVEVQSADEIGGLARSFNEMTTELHEREAALHEAHEQLIQSEKMAAFGQVGAGVAHEVKNPLAGILGCTQLALMDAEPDSELHEMLSLIERETRRCKQIIESLMRFARREQTALEPMAVNDAVHDAIAIVQHQLQLNQIEIERNLEDGLPVVKGSSNQMQQVLINLLINAQQAMKQDGTVTITTRCTEDENVEIVIADTGPGMPPEVSARIFEPFFTTKPTGQGTGLGLSVSFGIVEDHGGEITLESEPGEGTEFTIRIPVMKDAPLGLPVSV